MGLVKSYMAELEERGFGAVDGQAVCLACVLDPTLQETLRPRLAEHECAFCGARSGDAGEPIAVDFEDLMHAVMLAVRFLYLTVEDACMLYDSEDGVYVGGSVYDATEVAYAVCEGDVTDEVVQAIGAAIIEDAWTEAHGDSGPTRTDERLRYGWESLCDQVKHRSRFVFLSTADPDPHPDDITAPMLLRHLERIIDRHRLRRIVRAGRRFWRGRLTRDPDDLLRLANAEQLGSAPRHRASNNRFSPVGISMFYGSDSADTVVAEIGAHGTGDYAVIGAFETVRDLLLLDLVDLPPVPSPYTEAGRGSHFYDLIFLHRFVSDLTKPVVPDDHLHIEYVPTQVVTEYLRYAAASPVDGILFRGAQDGRVNTVLFCDPDGCVDDITAPREVWEAKPYLRFAADSAQLRLLSS
ncbi:HEPN-associated N-terminal domain-containing protein [Saccharothrix sp. BKS2]|uniref:HEPN-associated N-terminal domain-containing protein n=1 Tax=Saccharothrix sp. BKS2 TaxID=3064400 RepID=UPI0039ECEC6E